MSKFNNIYNLVLEGSDLAYKPVPLPYKFNDLEPFIDEETMSLHYNKHYKGYIKKLNNEISGSTPIVQVIENIKKYSDKVRNNAGGYYNHTLFWSYMTPRATSPSDELVKAISSKFTSLKNFREKFIESALSLFGSGWCWVVKKNNKLELVHTSNQDNPLMTRQGKPILGIDVWEHAYYKKYGPDRERYIENFFKVINWNNVSNNFIS